MVGAWRAGRDFATLADAQGLGAILSAPPAAKSLPALQAPSILEVRLVAGTTRLRFQSKAGRSYCVDYRDDLSAAAGWKPLAGAESLAGTGDMVEVFDRQTGDSTRGFYRLRLLP